MNLTKRIRELGPSGGLGSYGVCFEGIECVLCLIGRSLEHDVGFSRNTP